jgi:hypothetical protein
MDVFNRKQGYYLKDCSIIRRADDFNQSRSGDDTGPVSLNGQQVAFDHFKA